MTEKIVYLDSSAIIKRYVNESGTEIIRALYHDAYLGNVLLAFSLWNIGEILGVVDKAHRQQRISKEQLKEVLDRFSDETTRLRKIDRLKIIPLSERVIENSWDFVTKQHLYAADALQIASALQLECSEFLTGDRMLHSVALSIGFSSRYIG